MGLDQYAHLRNRKIDWRKYYDNDEEEQKDVFVWRKHARLQTFMNSVWQKQNESEAKKRNKIPEHPMDLSCLGMNAGDEVYITRDVVKDLKTAFEDRYCHYFCSDGYFWGQQFQEEAVEDYKEQDKKFLEWCEEQIENKKVPIYTCSW
tara:strand:+ start:1759 stop:2202 length:444 start_codon:yes stop_codon:yes gene_type:complete